MEAASRPQEDACTGVVGHEVARVHEHKPSQGLQVWALRGALQFTDDLAGFVLIIHDFSLNCPCYEHHVWSFL